MNARPAQPGDAAALAGIVRRAITEGAASVYREDQIAQWAGSFSTSRLRRVVASTSTFVVEEEGVAGFATLVVGEAGRGELDLLYVDPDRWGRGVARCAVEAVEAEARHRGLAWLWADASLLAVPVLEHLGYVVQRRYDKARGSVTFPNTWLVKELGRSRPSGVGRTVVGGRLTGDGEEGLPR